MMIQLLRTTLLFFLAVLFCSVFACSATLGVPSDYPTIQAAIDAAEAGDTVLIAGGSYAEQLLIGKDITLQGDSSGETSLDAQGGSAVRINSGIVSISDLAFLHGGENITILDPRVFGDGALSIRGDSYALVQRCAFGQSGMGVAIRDQCNVVLSDCSFESVDLPVLVAEAARCSLTQCTMTQSKWAVETFGHASIEITRSHIEDFIYVGLSLHSVAEALVRETTIVPPGKWAVKIDGKARLTMRQCQIKPGSAGELFSREAIEATNYAYVEISDSELEGGEDSLLRLNHAAEALLVRSQLMGEMQNAVYLSDESSIQINGCTIQGAQESSVWLTEESRARIVSCQFLDSKWGIALSGTAEATLVDSTLTGTAQDAIEVREHATVHLFDCEISEAVHGLDVQEEATCQFVGGVITNCSFAGVRVKGNASVEVTRAVVMGNYVGIFALDNATLSVFQTEVCMNDYGLHLGYKECVDPAPVVEYTGLILGRGNTIRDNEEIDLCPDEEDQVWPASFASLAAISVPHDYESIQDAIDAALPGDVILIESGLYQERLTIAKPISLEAVGVGPTILVPPEWSGVLIEVKPGCGGIWISDLEFRAASHAIEACLQAGDSLHLQGVTVFSAGLGIDVQGDGCLIVENAHIGYVHTGFMIEDIIAVIRDCSFINQELRAGVLFDADGVVLIGNAVASISDNLFINFNSISVRETRTTGATTEARRLFTGSVSGHDNSDDYDWAALLPGLWYRNVPWPSDFFDLGFGEQSSQAEQHMFAGLNALFGNGDALDGVACFEDALTILRETRHPILEAQVLYFLSMAEYSIGRNIEATEHYVRALYLSEQYYFDLISISLVEHAGDAMTHRYFEGLGQLTDAFKTAWFSFYRARRDANLLDYASALEEAEEARVTLEEILENSDGQGWAQELLWQVLLLLGDLHVQIEQNEEALVSYQQAARVIESVSINISSEDIRLFWYERTREVYERLVDLLFQMGEGNLAFPYVERCRARTFLDTLCSGGISPDQLIGPEAGISSGVVDALAIDASVTTAQGMLLPNEAVLEYMVTDSSVYLWVITSAEGTSYPLHVEYSREQLMNDVIALRQELETTSPDVVSLNSSLGSLYERLVQPGLALLDEAIDTLIFIPSGPLWYLPFSALKMSDKELTTGPGAIRYPYLVEKFTLTYLPSLASLPALMAAAPDTANPSLAAFANPTLSIAQIEALGISNYEYEFLEDATRGFANCYVGNTEAVYAASQANELKAYGNLETRTVEVYACHGMFNPYVPLQSKLLLAPGEEAAAVDDQRTPDGNYHAWEAMLTDHRGVELVVLTACETLLPAFQNLQGVMGTLSGQAPENVELSKAQLEQIVVGDEVVGLARAFLGSGAQAVLGTLWQANPRAIEQLLIAMCKYHQQGMLWAQALQMAQQELIVNPPFDDVWFWAPYQLIGRWR